MNLILTGALALVLYCLPAIAGAQLKTPRVARPCETSRPKDAEGRNRSRPCRAVEDFDRRGRRDESSQPAVAAGGFELCPNSMLEPVGQPAKVIKENGVSVPVYAEARVHGSTPVYLTGAGVYVKKVAFIKAKVYVAQSYIDTPSGMSATNPLDTIAGSRSKAMKLTLLRDVTADQIRDGFQAALKENGVDLAQPVMQDIFKQMTYDVKAGQSVTFVSYSDSYGVDHIALEGPQVYQTEGLDLGLALWKIWFGKTLDGGSADLKKALVGK